MSRQDAVCCDVDITFLPLISSWQTSWQDTDSCAICIAHMPCVLQTMALDPRYGSRKTREFMTGGLAGQINLNSRVSELHSTDQGCVADASLLCLRVSVVLMQVSADGTQIAVKIAVIHSKPGNAEVIQASSLAQRFHLFLFALKVRTSAPSCVHSDL